MDVKQFDFSSMLGQLKTLQTSIQPGSKAEKIPWWQTFTYPQASEMNAKGLISFTKTALFFQALLHDETVYDVVDKRYLKLLPITDSIGMRMDTINSKNKILIEALKQDQIKLVYQSGSKNMYDELFFSADSGSLYLEIDTDNMSIKSNLVTTDEKLIDKVNKRLMEYIK